MLWGTGTSILGTSWNLHIHSTFLSMQRTKIKHNWIWEIHRADKTRKGSIDRNLLGTWSTWNHLNASARKLAVFWSKSWMAFWANLKYLKIILLYSLQSALGSQRKLSASWHTPDATRTSLSSSYQENLSCVLSVSFPLQFVPEKACQQAQSRGPAKVQTCPVGMFCAFKAVIKQSSLQTWQHASPFAMRSLSTLLLEHILISAELGMSWNVALLGWLSTQLLACKLSDGRRKIIKINVHSHAKPVLAKSLLSCTIGSRSRSLRIDSGANSDRRSCSFSSGA